MKKLAGFIVASIALIAGQVSADCVDPNGCGTYLFPYLISTCDQLQDMDQYTEADTGGLYEYIYFELAGNVDCSATNPAHPSFVGSTWDDGDNDGFDPIGQASTDSFQGYFDGKGYEIQNLYINRPTEDYVGLFGYLYDTDLEIKNLKFKNVNITGDTYVGALAGYMRDVSSANDNLVRISVDGEINGVQYVGGITGYAYTVDMHEIYSGAKVQVSTTGTAYAGGVSGYSRSSYYYDIWSEADVDDTSGSADYMGGIIGYAYGTDVLRRAYASGSVEGDAYIGGIIGRPRTTNALTLQGAYSLSNVQGRIKSNIGGPSSYVSENQVYYLDTITDPALCFESDNGSCSAATKNFLQSQEGDLYSSLASATWDFTPGTGVWEFVPGVNDYYPVMQWLNTEVQTEPNEFDIDGLAIDSQSVASIGDHTLLIGNQVPDLAIQVGHMQGENVRAVFTLSGTTMPQSITLTGTIETIGASGVVISQFTSGMYSENIPYGKYDIYVKACESVSGQCTPYYNDESIAELWIRPAFAEGAGSHVYPYKISTCEQLQHLNFFTEANEGGLYEDIYFELANDIDCSATNPAHPSYSGSWWQLANPTDTEGFRPIGTSTSDSFQGFFDGKEYEIQNLYINRPSENNVGLFGYIYDTDPEIHNLKMTNVDITGQTYVGAIAGTADDVSGVGDNFKRIYVDGLVQGLTYVGGVVGYATPAYFYEIYADVVVEALDTGTVYAGGIVGYANSSTQMHDFLSRSDVSAPLQPTADYIGGAIGQTNTSIIIRKGYTTGTIIGDAYVGGIVGRTKTTASTVTMQGVYTLADVQGRIQSHIGSTSSAIAEQQVYYLDTGSGPDFCFEDADGSCAPATKDFLQSQEEILYSYNAASTWDFTPDTGIWEFVPGVNDGYPVMQWLNTEVQTKPTEYSIENVKIDQQEVTAVDQEILLINNQRPSIEMPVGHVQGESVYAVMTIEGVTMPQTITLTGTTQLIPSSGQAISKFNAGMYSENIPYGKYQVKIKACESVSGECTNYYNDENIFQLWLRPNFEAGDGTYVYPYQISTCEQLQHLNFFTESDSGGLYEDTYFEFINDIDCSATNPSHPDYIGSWWQSENQTGTEGFKPIGAATSDSFQGYLDGKEYEIQNLYINRPTEDYVGLFGYIYDTTIQIHNVKMTNFDIAGQTYVGSIAGTANDVSGVEENFKRISAQGSVKGQSYVGGIVGYATPAYFYEIYADVDVEAFATASTYAGGIIGYANASTQMHDFVSHSDVREPAGLGDYIGGAIGGTSTSIVIRKGYTTGTMIGDAYVGGIVGRTKTTTSTVTMQGVYTLADVQGRIQSHIGSTSSAIAEQQVYYLDTGSGPDFCFEDADGSCAPATKDFLQSQEEILYSYNAASTWDFTPDTGVWEFVPGVNDGYPVMQWLNTATQTLPNEYSDESLKISGQSVSLGSDFNIGDDKRPSLEVRVGHETGESIYAVFTLSGTTTSDKYIFTGSLVDTDPETVTISRVLPGMYIEDIPYGEYGLHIKACEEISGECTPYYNNQAIVNIIAKEQFEGGDGTSGFPYQIGSCEQLQRMEEFINIDGVYFELVDNIDCGDTNPSSPTYAGSAWERRGVDGKGFIPIGQSSTEEFIGYFNGNGYTISNLFINRPTEDYVGLFGYIYDGTMKLEHVKIANADITGDSYVGGLIGYMRDTSGSVESINKVSVTGNITGTVYVGGIAGYTYAVEASELYTNATVSALGTSVVHAGGIIGLMYTGTYKDMYSESDIITPTAPTAEYVGGITGYGRQTTYIYSSYTAGSVTGDQYVGGILGHGHTTNGVYMRDVYSIADVTGNLSGNIGGTASHVAETHVYRLDTQTTPGQCFTDGNGSCGVEDESYFQNQSSTVYTGHSSAIWDFTANTGVWEMQPGVNNGYPTLQWITRQQEPRLSVLEPQNGEVAVLTDADFSMKYSDANNDTADIEFRVYLADPVSCDNPQSISYEIRSQSSVASGESRTVNMATLQSNTQYFLCVQADDGTDISYSDKIIFTTKDYSNSPATIDAGSINPSNSSVGIETDLQISASYSDTNTDDVVDAELRVYDSVPDCTASLPGQYVAQDTKTGLSHSGSVIFDRIYLDGDVKYYWCASFNDEDDTSYAGPYTFTTRDPSRNTLEIDHESISPSSNQELVGLNSAIEIDYADAKSYESIDAEVRVYDFVPTCLNELPGGEERSVVQSDLPSFGTASFTPSVPLKSKTRYFWCVRMESEVDTVYAGPFSFVTENQVNNNLQYVQAIPGSSEYVDKISQEVGSGALTELPASKDNIEVAYMLRELAKSAQNQTELDNVISVVYKLLAPHLLNEPVDLEPGNTLRDVKEAIRNWVTQKQDELRM